MKSKSAIEKGKRFENHLVELLRAEVDAGAQRTSGSGNGLDKNDIRIPSLNVEIEAKNQGSISLLGDWEQTKRQRTTGNVAVLAIRHPRQPEFRETLVVMDLNDFVDLLKKQGGARVVEREPDNRQLKWKIERAASAIRELLKEIG